MSEFNLSIDLQLFADPIWNHITFTPCGSAINVYFVLIITCKFYMKFKKKKSQKMNQDNSSHLMKSGALCIDESVKI